MDGTTLAPLVGPDRNGSAASVATPDFPAIPEASAVRERVARPVQVPPEPRPSAATVAGLAVALAAAAIVLGALALAFGIGGRGDDAAPGPDARRALGLLSKPSTERIPLLRSGGEIVLAVGSGGRGALVVDDLAAAPSGKAYEAWVTAADGGGPFPAGVFSGLEEVVLLTRPVPPGATVGVTLESSVGVDVPTERPRFAATRPTG